MKSAVFLQPASPDVGTTMKIPTAVESGGIKIYAAIFDSSILNIFFPTSGDVGYK